MSILRMNFRECSCRKTTHNKRFLRSVLLMYTVVFVTKWWYNSIKILKSQIFYGGILHEVALF